MIYLFEDFALDTDRRELRRGSELLAVEPKVFDLLVHLIENRDRVVSKDDLIAAVWGGRIVSESTLTSCINAARSAVGDSGAAQRLIKTLPRKGLRFVGAVSEQTTAPRAPAGVADASRPALALPGRPSIAVLPFANMSGDPDQDYFADGISEDLITGLARIRWLFVVARNSTFVYKQRPVDVKQVARELGVRYVLEGSVRRAGNRLRIGAQLVDAISGQHQWGERYDRDVGDMFAVQDEITRSVAAAIEPNLLAAEGVRALSRSAEDLDAWDLVARAQTHIWRMTPADNETAIAALRQAVEAYPDYAPAQSLLGYCPVFAAHMGWIDPAEALGPARAHAMRAIALDERNPWAHIARGYVALMERRTEEMIAAFRRALDLNPNSAAAHAYLGHGLAFAGQHIEAMSHAQDAARLSPFDPLSVLFAATCAVAHFAAGRYPEAASSAAEALRLRPGFHGAYRMICASLALAGNVEEARALLLTARELHPQLSIDWARANVPYQTPQLMERYIEGMRKAGLGD